MAPQLFGPSSITFLYRLAQAISPSPALALEPQLPRKQDQIAPGAEGQYSIHRSCSQPFLTLLSITILQLRVGMIERKNGSRQCMLVYGYSLRGSQANTRPGLFLPGQGIGRWSHAPPPRIVAGYISLDELKQGPRFVVQNQHVLHPLPGIPSQSLGKV